MATVSSRRNSFFDRLTSNCSTLICSVAKAVGKIMHITDQPLQIQPVSAELESPRQLGHQNICVVKDKDRIVIQQQSVRLSWDKCDMQINGAIGFASVLQCKRTDRTHFVSSDNYDHNQYNLQGVILKQDSSQRQVFYLSVHISFYETFYRLLQHCIELMFENQNQAQMEHLGEIEAIKSIYHCSQPSESESEQQEQQQNSSSQQENQEEGFQQKKEKQRCQQWNATGHSNLRYYQLQCNRKKSKKLKTVSVTSSNQSTKTI